MVILYFKRFYKYLKRNEKFENLNKKKILDIENVV